MKKILLLMCLIGMLFLASCKSTPVYDEDKDLDLENVFFDDFDYGIDKRNWRIGHAKWGVGNGGVIHQNVHYTSDGVVVLQSNGDYYEGDLKGIGNDHGKRTGAKILTREALGPGRYEVRMKVLPRFGSTTAMWTYYYNNGLNHEIDIELNVQNSFRVMMTTNWLTVNDYSSKINKIETVLNDFEWHTFRFDWRTDPGRIDYYLDDMLISTQESYVPDHAGEFNIGNWFPDAWAGVPDFETDYTYVDWFKYTPFKNQPYVETPNHEASPDAYYPTAPIDYPVANLISNAGFENDSAAWKYDPKTEVGPVDLNGLNSSRGMFIPKHNIAYQMITGLDETFELDFSAYAKLPQNGSGYILFEFYPDETRKLDQYILRFNKNDENFKANEFYKKEISFGLPEGTKRVEVSIIGEDSEIYVDDLFMNLKQKPKPAEKTIEASKVTFFDDFSNGISRENWTIVNRKWGVGNGGVIYENVNYTQDGVLVLQANGDLYDGDLKGIGNNDGKRTGAAIHTNKSFGPGIYEVKAIAMPRFGATTAFWTYNYQNGINSEIDIELNVNNDFNSVWFTNWLTEENYVNEHMNTPVLNNDGNWHTYKFEWHTTPTPRIDYYIDGVKYHTATTKVPTLGAQFWVGVWFPKDWAGNPDFETDYLLIDYVKYESFDQDYEKGSDSNGSVVSFYPTKPIELPQANLIAQGDFSSSVGYQVSGDAMIKNNQLTIDENGVVSQLITGMHESFDLTFKTSVKGLNASVKVEFLNDKAQLISSKVFDITNIKSNEFTEKLINFDLVTNTRMIKIYLQGKEVTYQSVLLNLKDKVK